MRILYPASIFFGLVACIGQACSANSACGGYLDQILALNHLQAKGTHNSYHLKPDSSGVADWNYGHAPLNVQLGEYGVRQFELDILWQAGDDYFDVMHVPFLDANTTCSPLTDCLGIIKDWSDQQPDHHPLFIMIEPKDEFDEQVIEEYFSSLENKILSIWPLERLILPADVQGAYPTLRQAVLDKNWPLLADVRGKAMFILLDSEGFRDYYTYSDSHLDDRIIFARASQTTAGYAAIMFKDDPVSQQESIRQAVADGFMIRTRADSGSIEAVANDTTRLEAALSSGAHFISTDYPALTEEYEYWVEIPQGNPSRCNPVSAPAECSASAIEGWACL